MVHRPTSSDGRITLERLTGKTTLIFGYLLGSTRSHTEEEKSSTVGDISPTSLTGRIDPFGGLHDITPYLSVCSRESLEEIMATRGYGSNIITGREKKHNLHTVSQSWKLGRVIEPSAGE